MSNISRMHEDALDPDRHLWPVEPPEAYNTVLQFFSADTEEECERRIYKYTSCGASIKFEETGVVISSIVEGCNFGTATYPLHYADKFTGADIQARIDAVEKEAEAIWEWANRRCDKQGRWRSNGSMTHAEIGLDAPDVDYDYKSFEQGERSA